MSATRSRRVVPPAAGKPEARRCAYERCAEVFVTRDASARYCSGTCRFEHQRRSGARNSPGEGGDSNAGDGVFTKAEHATWSRNLDALRERVEARQRRGPLRKVVIRRGEIDVLECGDEIPDEQRKVLEYRRCGACFTRERQRPGLAALAETSAFVLENL